MTNGPTSAACVAARVELGSGSCVSSPQAPHPEQRPAHWAERCPQALRWAHLAELLGTLDRPALLEMARKARALGKPEAARIVADRCVELAR